MLRLSTRTTAPGLLMLSETYDPDWRAYVDNEPVPVLVADHLLRAVPLPAGEHDVVLRYEPRSLQAGVAITTVTSSILAALALRFVWKRWTGRPERPVVPHIEDRASLVVGVPGPDDVHPRCGGLD
jgi:uncharacterized membrane protein YfhO